MTTTAKGRHDFRLLAAALTAWAATAASLALHASPRMFLGLVMASLIFAVLLRRRLARPVVLSLCATALVMALTGVHEQRSHAGSAEELARDRAVVTAQIHLTGTAREIRPQGGAFRDDAAPKFTAAAEMTVITARGQHENVATPVVVIGNASLERVPWGSYATVDARLAPPKRFGQAQASVQVRGDVRDVRSSRLERGLDAARRGFVTATSHLPADAAGLVPALVVGDTRALPTTLTDDMNATGMSHLNAVSGSNTTIVLLALLWLMGWVGAPFRWRRWIALSALAVYVLLCHPEPSVIRAAVMGAVGVTATSVGRRSAACPALGAAIIALLCWDPWLSVNAGFALSALATLGLVLFASPWTAWLAQRSPRWAHKPLEMLTIPLAAQSLCLPILVVLGNGISLVSLPANALAEPFVAPATLAGMATFLVSLVSLRLAAVMAWLPGLPAWAIAWIAHRASGFAWTNIPWPTGIVGATLAVVAVAFILISAGWVRYLGRWRWALLSLTVLAVAAFRAPTSVPRPVSGWVFAVCDVGQGDAALISTGADSAVVIDVGPPEAHISDCLSRHGVKRIDALILSHYHADHVGGIEEITQPVSAVFVTPVKDGADDGGRGEHGARQQVTKWLSARHLVAQDLPADSHLSIGDLQMHTLWPRRVIHEGSAQNNGSLVVVADAPGGRMLFLGDLEREAGTAILPEVERLATQRAFDVVKVAHHGSSNQAPGLYDAIRASVGTISVGAGNDYGHPKPALLHMLEVAGTTAIRTDECGDIDFIPTEVGTRPFVQRCDAFAHVR